MADRNDTQLHADTLRAWGIGLRYSQAERVADWLADSPSAGITTPEEQRAMAEGRPMNSDEQRADRAQRLDIITMRDSDAHSPYCGCVQCLEPDEPCLCHDEAGDEPSCTRCSSAPAYDPRFGQSEAGMD